MEESTMMQVEQVRIVIPARSCPLPWTGCLFVACLCVGNVCLDFSFITFGSSVLTQVQGSVTWISD